MAISSETEEEAKVWKDLEKEHLAPVSSEITKDLAEQIESFRDEVRKFEGCGSLSSTLKSLFAATKFLMFYAHKLERQIEAEKRKRFNLLELYLQMAMGRDRARKDSPQRYNLRTHF